MMWSAKRRCGGFSLIEIMVVVAIIAILTIWAIPNYTAAKAQSQLKACRQNVMTIVNAVEMARTRHSVADICVLCGAMSSVGSWGDQHITHKELFPYLTENGYLATIPKCPRGKLNTDGYTYTARLEGNKGTYLKSGSIATSRVACSAVHIVNRRTISVIWYFGDTIEYASDRVVARGSGWSTGTSTDPSSHIGEYDVQ